MTASDAGRPARLDGPRLELRALVERSREVVLLAAVTGVLTGLVVALFDRITGEIVFAAVLRAPVWAQVVAPLAGLVLTALTLRFIGASASTSTADEYVKAMNDQGGRFELRPIAGRLVAAVATLGSGGAMGYEGPSLYLGAGIGAAVRQRLGRMFRGIDPNVALVAGAAAGVAAIFKAPATGAIFALEVPFQDDLARRSLLPALIGGATGYLSFVALIGTERLIPVSGQPAIGGEELIGAVLVGVACGLGARTFAALMKAAKRISQPAAWRRPLIAGVVGSGLVGASLWIFDGEPLTLGPGYRSIEWSLDPDRTLLLIALLATARVAATATTLAGGGVGGLFIPLVVQGALSGRLVAGLMGGHDQSLYVVLGIAAFLGAGYRVPLAAVMFVAEATGRPGFIVPGLIAAVVAQLLMGTASVSEHQKRLRHGHLEERTRLPITAALDADTATTSPEETLSRFVTQHVTRASRRAVPVTSNGTYLGMILVDDILALDPSTWDDATVDDVMRRDGPKGDPGWTVGQALTEMVSSQVDHLPVIDATGRLRGVVTSDAVLDLDRLRAPRGDR